MPLFRVQGSIGFGLAVVSAPALYLINPVLVPGPIIVTALIIGALTAKRYISALRIGDLQYAIAGRVPGSMLGGLLLSLVSARSMSLLLGGSVLMAVLASLTPIKFQANRTSLFTARRIIWRDGHCIFYWRAAYGTGYAK